MAQTLNPPPVKHPPPPRKRAPDALGAYPAPARGRTHGPDIGGIAFAALSSP
jgi:hypothetical protein